MAGYDDAEKQNNQRQQKNTQNRHYYFQRSGHILRFYLTGCKFHRPMAQDINCITPDPKMVRINYDDFLDFSRPLFPCIAACCGVESGVFSLCKAAPRTPRRGGIAERHGGFRGLIWIPRSLLLGNLFGDERKSRNWQYYVKSPRNTSISAHSSLLRLPSFPKCFIAKSISNTVISPSPSKSPESRQGVHRSRQRKIVLRYFFSARGGIKS